MANELTSLKGGKILVDRITGTMEGLQRQFLTAKKNIDPGYLVFESDARQSLGA